MFSAGIASCAGGCLHSLHMMFRYQSLSVAGYRLITKHHVKGMETPARTRCYTGGEKKLDITVGITVFFFSFFSFFLPERQTSLSIWKKPAGLGATISPSESSS